MAAKLRAMPTGATVPSAQAVIGAVASVAPTDDPSVRQPKLRPSAASVQRLNRAGPPERRGGQPAAEVEHRPGVRSAGLRGRWPQQLLGSAPGAGHPAAGDDQRQRCGPRGRRGPAEEPDVRGARNAARTSASAPVGRDRSSARAGRPTPPISPTWNPEMDSRCTSPDCANRSCRSGSMPPRRPSMSASTSGARSP